MEPDKTKEDSSVIPVTEMTTTLMSTTQPTVAQLFQWQKYWSLHVTANAQEQSLQESYWCNHLAVELNYAEQQLFFIVQSESYTSEKSNLLRSSPLS